MAASPKEKVGTKETPHLSASLTNPFFLFRISRTWIIEKTKRITLNKQANKSAKKTNKKSQKRARQLLTHLSLITVESLRRSTRNKDGGLTSLFA